METILGLWYNRPLLHGNGEMPHCSIQFQIFGHESPIMVIQKKKKKKNEIRHCIVWINLDLYYNPAVCWMSVLNTSWCWHPYGPLRPLSPLQSIPDGVSRPNRSSSTWSVWLASSLMTVREAVCESHTQFRAEFDRNEGRVWAFHDRSSSTRFSAQDEPDFMKYLHGLNARG